MKDSVFLDTNLLIYCYSVTEQDKQKVALEITQKERATISTQVLQELSNVLFKKFKLNWDEILMTVKEVSRELSIFVNHTETIKSAFKIAKKYKYSFYDSLIIAAALASGCSILYSEDLQHNQIIEGKLQIVNPFA